LFSLKEFLEERRRMLLIYNNLIAEEKTITDQYELKSSIKSLSTRWNEIVRKSDELTPKYDKQYSSWLVFESELNSFRDQILSELEQRVNTTVSTDVNKLFDLNRINTLLNELRVNTFIFFFIKNFLFLFKSYWMKISIIHRIIIVFINN
jgi:hypothetical protein